MVPLTIKKRTVAQPNFFMAFLILGKESVLILFWGISKVQKEMH